MGGVVLLSVEEPQLRRNWATVAHSRRELG